ncbi:hypothetical protein AGR7C_Lc100118 [Agrobacterium deltaense Zutra 3/1]|uniref:Uncharacterized protein n=1 Tax=Agrobacterium deltaense Zutra 3/1 TaxID=1183427 RepID=A0A1S7QS65_9HYPH|nr:hypothetical protein AGR7C_Lc100118 [Agrobacterium deltaense Zutra 3/1]
MHLLATRLSLIVFDFIVKNQDFSNLQNSCMFNLASGPSFVLVCEISARGRRIPKGRFAGL